MEIKKQNSDVFKRNLTDVLLQTKQSTGGITEFCTFIVLFLFRIVSSEHVLPVANVNVNHGESTAMQAAVEERLLYR